MTSFPRTATTTRPIIAGINDVHQVSRTQTHDVSHWSVESSVTPMLNQEQLDDWTERLQVFQMPEMVFDSRMTFRSSKHPFTISFHAFEALEYAMIDVLKNQGSKHIKPLKVEHAWDQEKKKKDIEEWNRKNTTTTVPSASRIANSATTTTIARTTTTTATTTTTRDKNMTNITTTASTKTIGTKSGAMAASAAAEEREDRIDWTFTSIYRGTIENKDQVSVEITQEHAIDYERLKRRDPIKFYDEVVLFEDELHDFGHCTVSVKTRVMDEYFFVLLRCFLRVDKVILRIIDTRFYHEYDKDYIVREDSLRQESYESIRRRHPLIAEDPRLITNVNWLSSVLPELERQTFKISAKKKVGTTPSSSSEQQQQ